MECVRVALRIRPLVRYEQASGCQEAVERTPGAPQVTVNRSDAFTFNYVFDANDSQELVYTECVLEMLDKLFDGFNTTILAYGQTGSGKTHTMGTAFDGAITEEVGVIPRAMVDIFARISKLAGETDFIVKCSFMELYQEQLFDLLSNKSREESVVDIREDRSGIIIPSLTEMVVNTAKETTDCLVRGSSGRAVASTAMNEQSSRSHAIFTLTLQATRKDDINSVITSKFHLVDLAGSERSKKTQSSGERFKEGVKINQGLLALGNVISALGSGQGSGFVRYRDSKLTRLLQDSLGGNSITLMIACVSPADYNVNETLSTLRYADRARKIKNKPIVNQDPHVAEINHLKGVIQKLRLELLASNGSMSSSLTGELEKVATLPTKLDTQGDNPLQLQKMQDQLKLYQRLQEKYQLLQQQLQITLHDVAENEMRAHIAEAAHEKLKAKTDEMKTIVDELVVTYSDDSRMKQFHNLIHDMDAELERTQSEISEHKRRFSMNSELNNSCNNDKNQAETAEISELMQEQSDAYTNKQVELKEELRRVNRELNLKVELHDRVRGNLKKFCGLEDNIEEKVKDCELKIQELEAEKTELLDKLKHVKENASAKLAEERRKRLQALEQEIGEFKKKTVQQAKMLKLREKETQKILNLNTEIQSMKESKVKLIRAMRQESEYFRQWKLTREKELMQLKNKDRKMQNEMARKEALHTKQRNVLKRKCEEAMAINKRLKDALERQKVAQSQRQKNPSKDNTKSKIEQVITWVERELEVIISLIDAEHSLEQLMEDRGIISSRINELKQQQQKRKVDSPEHMEAAQELRNLQEERDMRNAQISDLQQKVCAANLDARMRSLCENIQSLGDARAVLNHLLKTLSEMRRENANRIQALRSTIEDQRTQIEAAEEQVTKSAKRMRLLEIEHEEAIAERENTYEDKIALLLRELYNAPQPVEGAVLTPEQMERIKIQEEQLNKMETLREELEQYKTLVEQLQNAVKQSNKKKVPKPVPMPVIEDLSDSEATSDMEFYNEDSDPDWVKTPLVKSRKTRTFCGRQNSSNFNNSDGSNMDDTFATAATSQANANETSKQRTKRTNKNGCSCRSGCNSKRCGCLSINMKCTPKCRCIDDCCNGKHDHDENTPPSAETTATNSSIKSESDENETLRAPEAATNNIKIKLENNSCETNPILVSSYMTPKMARLSTITFDTPTVKKKFFE